jgi:hypothetical protein
MISFETTALLVTWIAIALLGLALAGLVRQMHALTSGGLARARGLGLPAGAAAPEFGRLSPDPAKPTALLFLDNGCGSCTAVLDEVRTTVARDPAPRLSFGVVFPGPVTRPLELGDNVLVHTDEHGLFAKYGVPAAPFAVLVDQAGRVQRSTPLGSAAALRELIADNLTSPTTESSLPGVVS